MFRAIVAVIKGWFKALFAAEPALDDQVTSEQWVKLGNSLSDSLSLGAGLEATDSDHWTTEKLVQMGESLSHIHPGL